MGDSPEEKLAALLNVSVADAPKSEEEIRARLRAGGVRAEALREDEPAEAGRREEAPPPEARPRDPLELMGAVQEEPLVPEEELRRAEELQRRMSLTNGELAAKVLESVWMDGHVRVATDGFGRLLSLDVDQEAVRQPRGLGYALVEAINSARHDARETALARRAAIREEVTGEA